MREKWRHIEPKAILCPNEPYGAGEKEKAVQKRKNQRRRDRNRKSQRENRTPYKHYTSLFLTNNNSENIEF